MFELRPYQQQAIDTTYLRVGEGHRPIICAPCGSGKTVIAGQMAKNAMDDGKRVLWMTGREEIIRQAYRTFSDMCGVKNVGVLCAGLAGEAPWWFYPRVTIASWDTLKARWHKSDSWKIPAELVLIDEAHLSLSEKMRETVLPFYQDRTVVGFTATPARKSGKGLGSFYSRIIQVQSVQQIIDEGYLAPCEYWAGSHADTNAIAHDHKTGDYKAKELGAAHRDGVLIGDVVDNWLRLAKDRHTIVFAVDIAHAQALTERFQAASIAAEVIHSKLPHGTREQISEQFRSGQFQVLINVGIATYGYDVPEVNCVVVARPTKSIVLWHQMVGRGMRPKDGDHCCIAEGQRVLTDQGLVPIERVTSAMLVWDGDEFVPHVGVVYQGEKEVIRYAGLTATADHEVWTAEGRWRSFGQCARDEIAIRVTGDGGQALRESDAHFRSGEAQGRAASAVRAGRVRRLWRACVEELRKFAARHGWLPSLRSWARARHPEMALDSVQWRSSAVHESEESPLSRLWRARHRVPLRVAYCNGLVDSGELGLASAFADRPEGKPRPLRSWQPSLGHQIAESAQHPKARTRVYDILNCGPRHRFTVEGLLVSNCVLDHGDNVRRLGCIEDKMRWRLDEGREAAANTTRDGDPTRQKKPEAPPIECGQCHYVFARSRVCPKCGWEKPVAAKDVETIDAELVRVRKARAELDLEVQDQRTWYLMVRGWAEINGKKPGMAYYRFKEKFKAEPPPEWSRLSSMLPNARVSAEMHRALQNFARRQSYAKRRAGAGG